jgi:hypothetical protein
MTVKIIPAAYRSKDFGFRGQIKKRRFDLAHKSVGTKCATA